MKTLFMIVDDSLPMRKKMSGILEGLGFRCIEVENTKEAHEVCQVLLPEVIILDWDMPVTNGLEFLCSLRSMSFGHYSKVLLCATQNTAQFIESGMTAGADGYIMKPFDTRSVISKLNHLGILK